MPNEQEINEQGFIVVNPAFVDAAGGGGDGAGWVDGGALRRAAGFNVFLQEEMARAKKMAGAAEKPDLDPNESFLTTTKRVDRFTDLNKVSQKMTNCVLRYKGRPIYSKSAHTYNKCIVICFSYLDEASRNYFVDHSDEELDITIPPVGYVFDGDYAYYVNVIPVRMNRYGLHRDNIVVNTETPIERYGRQDRLTINDLISMNLGKCINGLYDSFDSCWKPAKKLEYSRPFSREFCINRSKKGIDYLSWKNTIAGIFLDKNTISLSASYDNPLFIKHLNSSAKTNLKVIQHEG